MSDFENLNNAIVRAAALGGPWSVLNNDWQSDVAEPRTWKEAIPPLWSSLLESYWVKYAKLYVAMPDKSKLIDPKTFVPGGLAAAVTELYAPTASAVQQTEQQIAAAVQGKLKAVEDAVNAKLSSIAQGVGKEIAKGAQQQTFDWAWGLGGLAAGAVLLWLLLRDGGRGAAYSGLSGMDHAYPVACQSAWPQPVTVGAEAGSAIASPANRRTASCHGKSSQVLKTRWVLPFSLAARSEQRS